MARLTIAICSVLSTPPSTTARAEYHANIIKEKANLRKLIELSDVLIDEAERGEKSFNEIIAYAENQLSNRSRSTLPSKSLQPADYFVHQLKADIDQQNVAPLSPRYFLKFCWQ